jgi:hypothetical protein
MFIAGGGRGHRGQRNVDLRELRMEVGYVKARRSLSTG